jgi:hypothetical protein
MPSYRRDAVAPSCLVDPFHHPIDTVRDLDNRQSVSMILAALSHLQAFRNRPLGWLSCLYLIGKSDERFVKTSLRGRAQRLHVRLCSSVAAALQGTFAMRRLILNLVAGLGLAALADAVHHLSRRASYRGSRKPLAGPRPGS